MIEAVFKDFLFFRHSGSDLKHSEMLEKNPAVSAALPFICPEIGQTSLGIPSLGIKRRKERQEAMSGGAGVGGGGRTGVSPAALLPCCARGRGGDLLQLTLFLLQTMK